METGGIEKAIYILEDNRLAKCLPTFPRPGAGTFSHTSLRMMNLFDNMLFYQKWTAFCCLLVSNWRLRLAVLFNVNVDVEAVSNYLWMICKQLRSPECIIDVSVLFITHCQFIKVMILISLGNVLTQLEPSIKRINWVDACCKRGFAGDIAKLSRI